MARSCGSPAAARTTTCSSRRWRGAGAGSLSLFVRALAGGIILVSSEPLVVREQWDGDMDHQLDYSARGLVHWARRPLPAKGGHHAAVSAAANLAFFSTWRALCEPTDRPRCWRCLVALPTIPPPSAPLMARSSSITSAVVRRSARAAPTASSASLGQAQEWERPTSTIKGKKVRVFVFEFPGGGAGNFSLFLFVVEHFLLFNLFI